MIIGVRRFKERGCLFSLPIIAGEGQQIGFKKRT